MLRRRSTALVLLPLLLAGCGGSGDRTIVRNDSGDRVGPRVTIDWPARVRGFSAPQAAAFATVTVPNGGANGADATATVARPDGTAAVSQTYTVPIAVEPGRRLLRIDFYATSPNSFSGTSLVLATTTLNVIVANDGTLRTLDGDPLGTVGFTSNVAAVSLATGQTVEVGATASLGVIATAVNGAIAALPPSAVSYRIASGTEFLRANPDGTFTGIAPGTATVAPTVGGISGEPVAVTVLPAPIAARVVNLTTSDLVADSTRNVLYAALPSNAVNGNAVVRIDPATGATISRVPVGSNPSTLALSDDGTNLYVGLRGGNAVRRVDLNTDTAAESLALPPDPTFNVPTAAIGIAVQPGSPLTIAVTTQFASGGGPSALTIFDNGVPRPNRIASTQGSRLLWTTPNRILTYNDFSSNSGLSTIAVDPQGATSSGTVQNGAASSGGRIAVAGGRLYDQAGGVFDAATLDRVGNLPLPTPVGQRYYGPAVDPAVKRAYFVEPGFTAGQARLLVYDTETLTQVAVRRIENLGDTSFPFGDATVISLGARGIVVSTNSRLVFLSDPTGL